MNAVSRQSTQRRVAVTIAALIAFLFLAPAAGAHHKPDHPNGAGNADNPTPTGVTEDSDTDGVANVPDPAGDTDNQHPSGKDRHADNGVTGHSQSDPDGMENGGADKPGGSGGVDQLDQDGNNGCGNDDDFEDDNNGNCGGKNKPNSKSRVASASNSSAAPGAVTHSSASGSSGTSGAVVFHSVAVVDHEVAAASVADSASLTTLRADESQAVVLGATVSAASEPELARAAGGSSLGRTTVAGTDDEDRPSGYVGEMARTGLAMGLLTAAGWAFIAAARALRRFNPSVSAPA